MKANTRNYRDEYRRNNCPKDKGGSYKRESGTRPVRDMVNKT
jgi:hypothetical protein